MSRTIIERIFLSIILVTYLAIAVLYATRTPLWQAPDEPAHYNYIAQVAQQGCCPIIAAGDWDNDYLEAIKAARFSDQAVGKHFNTIQYEDHQPPLYYLLASPVFNLSGGNPIALRLFSVILGAGVVVLAWAVIRTTFPAHPALALAAAGFVAFLPQHMAMMSSINNDPLAELIVGANLLACSLYLGNGNRHVHPVIFGILGGLTLLTKITAVPVLIVAPFAVLLRARREKWSFGKLVIAGLWIAIPALLIAMPWWLRNISTYGGTDFMAQVAHDRVVVGQLQTSQYITEYGISGWLSSAAQITFNSFWGQFGWMGVPMTDTIYGLLAAFTIFVLVGALISLIRWRTGLSASQHEMLLIFALSVLITFGGLVYWNLKFVQFQGRYLFPALIPIAGVVACGLSGWSSLLDHISSHIRWIIVLVVLGFALLDVYILFRIIVPALAL